MNFSIIDNLRMFGKANSQKSKQHNIIQVTKGFMFTFVKNLVHKTVTDWLQSLFNQHSDKLQD